MLNLDQIFWPYGVTAKSAK